MQEIQCISTTIYLTINQKAHVVCDLNSTGHNHASGSAVAWPVLRGPGQACRLARAVRRPITRTSWRRQTVRLL